MKNNLMIQKYFGKATLLIFTLCSILSSTVMAQNPTVINDSLIVNQRVYAKEKLIVDKEAKFKEDVKILGTARISGDLIVDGTSKLNGNVKMENLGAAGPLTAESQIIIILPNGQLKKGTIAQMEQIIYAPFLCVDGDIASPQWASGLNKIYSECDIVKVGIGTSTPAHKLHVVGTNYAMRYLAGNSGGSTNATMNVFAQNDSEDLIRLGIKIGGTPEEVRFKVQNDGTVYAKELRIRLVSDFPDYVFDENYQLMSIQDLSKYIQENHHLPNMPTASDVKKGGLAIGDLTARLVEKVEELTLYTIELKEENNDLRTELEELKKEVQLIKESLNK